MSIKDLEDPEVSMARYHDRYVATLRGQYTAGVQEGESKSRQKIREMSQTIQEKDQAIQEKNQAIQEMSQTIQEKDQEIEQLRKKLREKESQEENE